jgi:phage gp36-like protein
MPPTPIYRYCSADDVARLGINIAALRSIPPVDVEAAIDEASAFIDSFLKGAEYILPLTAVGPATKGAAAVIATWRLMKARGFNPEIPAHALIRVDYEDKVAWLKLFMSGAVIPDVSDSAGVPEEVSPGGVGVVVSSTQRGWYQDSRVPGVSGAFTGSRR